MKGLEAMRHFCLSALCGAMILTLTLAPTLMAADRQEIAQTAQAGEDNDGAIAAAAVGAYGEDHSERRPEYPSTTHRALDGFLIGYSVFMTLATLGLIGGWVGTHYTRDPNTPPPVNCTAELLSDLSSLCQHCLQPR